MTEGLSGQGFDLDLAFGQSRESAFYHSVTQAHVECKSDQKCRQTGNVFVEIEQKGRPSGIEVSTAKWWAIEVEDDRWVFIRTSLLRELVRHYYQEGNVRRGGDNNNYVGVLIPVVSLVRDA